MSVVPPIPDIDFAKQGGGSQQMRTFRRTLRDTGCVASACKASDHSLEEAKLLIAMDEKNPPRPEDFEPIPTRTAPPPPKTAAKEPEMTAKPKEHEENGDISGEYQRPDAAIACEIYDEQIAPKIARINTIKGDLSEPWDQLKEQSRIPRVVFNFVQKLVDEDDDQKRDHALISLAELLKARGLSMPRDLVTMAGGDEGGDIVPTGERKRPFLAAVDGKPAEDEEGFEASEDELAAQKSRPSAEQAQAEADATAEEEPEPGTGAAARKSMKGAGKKEDA